MCPSFNYGWAAHVVQSRGGRKGDRPEQESNPGGHQGGQVVATRDELGQWRVEAAELHRVYPAVERRSAGGDAAQPPAAPDDSAVGPQVDAIIRRAEERLRQQLDDVRRDQARRGPAQAPPGAAHRASAGGT